VTAPTSCAHCGAPMSLPTGRQARKRYCSDLCRKAAWRDRHRDTLLGRDVVPDSVVVPTASRDAVATPGGHHRCPHCRRPLAIISVVIPADAATIHVPEVPHETLTDRYATTAPPGEDDLATLGNFGERQHKQHGGNIQVLTDPTGYPVWVSDVEPGSTHDITAARAHALPALYPAAARGLPTLTDKGYVGAGIGVHVPIKGHNLHPDHQTRNVLISALRAPAERANALLKRTWNALERITLDPWRIGAITAAALVLLHLQRPVR
jgi:DDE superfamily endonuclease